MVGAIVPTIQQDNNMAFATDNQLLDLIPTIYDHGRASFQTELNRAEVDVTRKIQIEWSDRTRSKLSFNPALLTSTQWADATLYRALGFYIMPMLSQWRVESDSFREQMEFYQERFAEEMADQFAIGIEYDEDEDGIISESEISKLSAGRLYR